MPGRQPVRRGGPRELGDCRATSGKEHSRALLPRGMGTGVQQPQARGPTSAPESRVPRRFSSPISKAAGLFPQRGERCSAAPGAVPSRAEKGEGPEGPLSTPTSGWESQVEPQGFMWQPCLNFPPAGWRTATIAPCKEGPGARGPSLEECSLPGATRWSYKGWDGVPVTCSALVPSSPGL